VYGLFCVTDGISSCGSCHCPALVWNNIKMTLHFLYTFQCHCFVCCRLFDVVSGQRTHHELHLMLIFEHIDQDLAQFLEKNASGLSPEYIQACSHNVT